MHDLDLICRAHQVVADGYAFFAGRKMVTIFSAPNYMGKFDNDAAVMIVDESLCCKFKCFKKPINKKGDNDDLPEIPQKKGICSLCK